MGVGLEWGTKTFQEEEQLEQRYGIGRKQKCLGDGESFTVTEA